MVSPSTSRMFENNELIINYHDAVIYGWDLKLIERRTEWLNDSCIHFFFTLLQQQHQSCVQTSEDASSIRCSFLFMDPSVVSFWMHQCIDQDEIDDFVTSTQFPGKENNRDGIIFIAVNDSMSTKSSSNNAFDSGSHWSLLVIEIAVSERFEIENKEDTAKTALRFSHYDSVRNSGNVKAAEEIAAKICLHVYPEVSVITKSLSVASNFSKVSNGLVHQADTPQQQNSYDCGVHALGAAKILSKYASMTNSTSDKEFKNICDSPHRRLQDLEKCLRIEIGNDSQIFCSRLRHEISSEIRRLHNT